MNRHPVLHSIRLWTAVQTVALSIFWSISAMGTNHTLPVCEQLPGAQSTLEVKEELLGAVKTAILEKVKRTERDLEDAADCLSATSQDEACAAFRSALVSVTRDQLRVAKIAQALTWKRINHVQRITAEQWAHEINMDRLQPEEVANFKQPGFQFTSEDKDIALHIWKRIFLFYMDQEVMKRGLTEGATTCSALRHIPVVPIAEKVREHFQGISKELLSINPLLAFITEENLEQPTALSEAFQKLLVFNKEFEKGIENLQTRHEDGLWSTLNLTLKDHEMGLVNFPSEAQKAIQKMSTEKRPQACGAWAALEKQQSTRVKSSIGVGFSTAVVCGVGIWSGLGTLPAAASCSLAVADGLLGGYRGYADSRMAFLSAYAGRNVHLKDRVNDGLRDFHEAEQLTNQGRIVFLINMIGLIPVARGVSHVVKGARGDIQALAKVPASDSMVSVGEVNSSGAAALIALMRTTEWSQNSRQGFIQKSLAADLTSICRSK